MHRSYEYGGFGHGECRGRGRAWGFGFDPHSGPWSWNPGGRRGGGRRWRMFGQGDLKYVILQMLSEKPRHGYEIIKELEERFGGTYAPSAGTVYPTLSLLEDMGYASVSLEEGGRKVYAITDEGRKYLEENKSAVEDIFERISDYGSSFLSEPMMDINRAFGRLARAAYGNAPSYAKNKERAKRAAEILDEAARRLDELGSAKG
jgi:DNA-binding PadR family transcriptional regulator